MIICNSGFNMIRAFLHHRFLLRQLTGMYITLIPQKENPTKVNDLRPISLCNVAYKFISKVLAKRLRDILPTIISALQSAFVPNIDIHDNLLIAH